MPENCFRGKRIIICGHRGEMTCHPENTMAAFQAAVGYGVDMIETDMHMTKDKVIVLRHDMVIPGAGRVCDHTYDELLKVKPDLPTLEEFLEFMMKHPDVALNMEFKDIPEPADRPVQKVDSGTDAVPEELAYECQDMAIEMLKAAGVASRTWINSFSGRLVERVYLKEGRSFHYHGFYPWFIMGEMSVDPESFVDVACMQHRYRDEAGNIIKYDDPLCPGDWWEYVASKGICPLAAPSLKTYENFDAAFRFGARMVNANDPKGMIGHLRSLAEKEKGSGQR